MSPTATLFFIPKGAGLNLATGELCGANGRPLNPRQVGMIKNIRLGEDAR